MDQNEIVMQFFACMLVCNLESKYSSHFGPIVLLEVIGGQWRSQGGQLDLNPENGHF